MAPWNHEKTKFGYTIFVFVALHCIFSNIQVQGSRSVSSDKTELAKHVEAIKTIQSDGDVIDCVDIYKQPAFDHPLLKNHTIQMKPSYYPRGMKLEKLKSEFFQGYIECPEGTVAIVRAPTNKSTGAEIFPKRKYYQVAGDPKLKEYAQVHLLRQDMHSYFGASARINVWNPKTYHDGEFSLAQVQVYSFELVEEVNTMEAGWQTFPGYNQPRLFIYWTSDGYKNTGCYNLDCPGFVQTSNKALIGGRLGPVSTYGGQQYEIGLSIHLDKQSGNWWLRFQDQDIGYWPGSIFTVLKDRASTITWGGEIINLGRNGFHTSTEMGSGHFADEDFGHACFFRNLQYVDDTGAMKDADNIVPSVTRHECYDVITKYSDAWKTHFYFGGPGYSDKCSNI